MMTKRTLFPALTLALMLLLGLWSWRNSPPSVHAQAPAGLCDQHKAMASTPSGSSFTVASALSNQTVYVCGYVLGGDAATTAVTFQSNGTSITGPIRIGSGLSLVVGADAVNIYGTPGQSVTVLVGTGNASGYVTFGQR